MKYLSALLCLSIAALAAAGNCFKFKFIVRLNLSDYELHIQKNMNFRQLHMD